MSCADATNPECRQYHAPGDRIENGFYYDFDYKEPFTDKDLAKIQKARAPPFVQQDAAQAGPPSFVAAPPRGAPPSRARRRCQRS